MVLPNANQQHISSVFQFLISAPRNGKNEEEQKEEAFDSSAGEERKMRILRPHVHDKLENAATCK
jgi:hypothetical protein